MVKQGVRKVIRELVGSDQFRRNPYFYLYDAGEIDRKLALLRERPENVSLYYAMKANPNGDILAHMRRSPSVDGIEIASAGELSKALEFFGPNEILFTGPGKTPFELEDAISHGIRLINLESPVEAYRINSIAEGRRDGKVDVLVRINTDYHLDGALENMAGQSTKMGIDQSTIGDALQYIRGLPNLNLLGFHVFNASGVLDQQDLLRYVRYVFDLMRNIERTSGESPRVIDFGGGFGIDYSGMERTFDTRGFFGRLSDLTRQYGFGDRELILELGRYIVGDSGYYVTEVLDIKDSKGKKHIVAAGGVNHLRLPSASEINQPVHIIGSGRPRIVPNQPYVDNEVVDVGGPLCFTEDRLAMDVHVDHAEVGDILVVSKAGAYGYSVSSLELLSHPYPPEYLIDCGAYHG